MGFDYIVSVPLLPSHGFFFMSLNLTPPPLFWVDSSLPVGYSAVSCDFGMLVKGGELKVLLLPVTLLLSSKKISFLF